MNEWQRDFDFRSITKESIEMSLNAIENAITGRAMKTIVSGRALKVRSEGNFSRKRKLFRDLILYMSGVQENTDRQGEVQDLTSFRIGRRTDLGKIVVCPACGRKGAILEPQLFDGNWLSGEVVHSRKFCGGLVETTPDVCWLEVPPCENWESDWRKESKFHFARIESGLDDGCQL